MADFDVKSSRGVQGNNQLDDGGHATGWSAGGGLEYAATDNLLVRAEFLHDEYTDEKGICGLILGCNNFEVGFTDNIVRLGVSWKFMGGMAFGAESNPRSFSGGGASPGGGSFGAPLGLSTSGIAAQSPLTTSTSTGTPRQRTITGINQNEQLRTTPDAQLDATNPSGTSGKASDQTAGSTAAQPTTRQPVEGRWIPMSVSTVRASFRHRRPSSFMAGGFQGRKLKKAERAQVLSLSPFRSGPAARAVFRWTISSACGVD